MKKVLFSVGQYLCLAGMFGMKASKTESTDNREFFPLAQAEILCRTETNKQHAKKQKKVAQSTKTNEQTALNLFGKWLGWDIKVSQINMSLIIDFDNYLRGLKKKDGRPKLKNSTIAEYLRSLRAVMVRLGLPGEELFSKVDTKNGISNKRALCSEDVQKLGNLMADLNPDSFDYKALKLFFFLLLADGMPLVNMAFLKWKQIGNGLIVYNRHKTGVEVTVPVNNDMAAILETFLKKDKKSANIDDEYVFQLLESYDPYEAMKEYSVLLGRFNRALHRIGDLAGLSVPLTSYSLSHSKIYNPIKINLLGSSQLVTANG